MQVLSPVRPKRLCLTTYQFDLTYCQEWTERRDSNGTGLAVSGGSRLRAE